ncbi:MAG: hypothetical protein H6984_11970 [Pseudomonadales bacterium]|nr:hypothetical protein [Pseudomonadales bacterium]
MKHTRGSWLAVLALSLFSLAPLAAENAKPSRHLRVQDGRTLEVLISAQFKPAMRDNLLQWTDYIAAALREVYGHWPAQHWQIVISPTAASADDPIPWAQVHRGELDRVEFFTTPNASADELRHTWTGYHELAHLLIPYRGSGDAWFSEGLASYYQNILQARSGLISEQQMWQKLYNGFQRGLAETKFDGRSLRSVSDRLRKDGGFMRVYWSGAWYFLAADTRLRLQSGGQLNLDRALAKLNDCCAGQRLAVPGIIARLDQLNRVLLFHSLYEEVAASTRVPPFDSIFASMGIDVIDGEIHLQEHGPGARLRREIVAGPGVDSGATL